MKRYLLDTFDWLALSIFLGLILLGPMAQAQVSVALAPTPKLQFFDASGAPLAGGCVFTYQAGTTTAQATYTDSTGTVQAANPIVLDSGGFASIWITNQIYKFSVFSSGGVNCASGAFQYSVDNVSSPGLVALSSAVLLNPANGAEQDVAGIVGATSFHGTSAHTTSTGVRVAILDPTTTLDAASNPPNLVTVAPATASLNYRIPDPGVHAVVPMSPDPNQTGANALDCSGTAAGATLVCMRYGFLWFEGGGCNNQAAAMGWDTFGTNSPKAACVTGTNVQKGVLALPSAASKDQEQSVAANCNTTCTLQYPAATSAGDLLLVVIAVDGSKTVSSVSDGTNAYTKATSITNGTTDLEVWYFNGNSTGMAASSTLTITVSAQANIAADWFAYKDIKTTAPLDVTATNSGTSTSPTTGTTAGTAQATELVIAAVASPSNPAVTFASGWVGHSTVSQSTNITVSSEGLIQQALATESGSFTLNSSLAWASAVVTFKANVGATTSAQRQILLPSTYVSSLAINAPIKWQAPLLPTGTVNTKLGAALACVADGSTDDPSFNAATTATVAVPNSTANTLTTTNLNGLTATGCVASSILHFQIQRLRYDPSDTYEGYIYVDGAGLLLGVK